MPVKDKRIDAYIEKAQPFARPVLKKLRLLVYKGVPAVQETIKWGMPFFDYKGTLCSFASFKEHAVFGFWKYKLLNDPKGYLQENAAKGGTAMGNFGRIKSLNDLPPDKVIIDFLKQAKKLNEENVKLPVRKKTVNSGLKLPQYFTKELKKNKQAAQTFQELSPSHKREYLEWITEAKTEPTRRKRLETSIVWLSEGKSRNWKYQSKKKYQ